MVEVYQLRIFLREISPAIWRRFLLRSDQTLTDLHYVLQIIMNWSGFHLHRFTIRGRYYEASSYDPVKLASFDFRHHERFLYEYDFGDLWQHEIRLEKRLPLDPKKNYPICIGGSRSSPEEDCGGPIAFMALESHYSLPYMADIIWRIIEGELSRDDYWEELQTFTYWLRVHHFDRRSVNRWLQQYAVGDEEWRWS